MSAYFVLIALILIVGFFVAWNIGANDVANAMGTSVGSGALTLTAAVILAAIFEFAGAAIVGSNVSETVRKKLFDPEIFTTMYGPQAPYILACGMIAALLAAGTWLMIATYMSWPVSTTHSIVGAVVGFGCMALGFSKIAWSQVTLISAGWIVSPLISGTIAYLLFGIILKSVFFKRNPVRAAKRVSPLLAGITIFVMTGMTAFKGLKSVWKAPPEQPDWKASQDPMFILSVTAVAVLLGAITYVITHYLVRNIQESPDDSVRNPVLDADVSRSLAKATMHLRRVENSASPELQSQAAELSRQVSELQQKSAEQVVANTDSTELKKVERIFVVLQILTACLVAFAHGANDVANAIGPLSAAFQAVQEMEIKPKAVTPLWALLLGGTGIVIGLATWGWRVIKTVGEKITELTPSRGFCAEFAAAITILLASVLPIGLPVSTTHTLVGAVLGVGLARGINALNLKTMRDIVAGWIITIPAGASLAVIYYFILKGIFVDSGWIDPLLK